MSIKLLAQDVLLSSPNFARKSSIKHQKEGEGSADNADVQLALPGELTRKHLKFERPITVYVSLYNPGAALAMEALQDGFLKLQVSLSVATVSVATVSLATVSVATVSV